MSDAKRNHRGISTNTVIQVLLRDQFTCQDCGITQVRGSGEANLQIHHVIPRGQGGSNDPDNLLTLCRTCHVKADQVTRRHSFSRHRQAGDGIALPGHIKSDAHLAVSDLAKMLDISRQRAHKLVKDGRIPAQFVAGHWQIKAADVAQFQFGKPGRPRGSVRPDPIREATREKARQLRAAGATYRAIADSIGVGQQTVFKWLKPKKDPDFIP